MYCAMNYIEVQMICMVVKLGSHSLRNEHKLQLFENTVLRKISALEREGKNDMGEI
jgi:hypothetical protein